MLLASDSDRSPLAEGLRERSASSAERGLLATLRRTFIRFERHRVDAVVELLPPGGDLLDVGCGPGGLLGKVARRTGCMVGVLCGELIAVARREA